MPNPTTYGQPLPSTYDPRWFIWTIVFLLVTGVLLTTYILYSSTTSADDTPIPVHHTVRTTK